MINEHLVSQADCTAVHVAAAAAAAATTVTVVDQYLY
jgi:hypothetical protein